MAGAGQYKRGLRSPKERRQITLRLSRELQDFAEREAYLRSSLPPYEEVTLSDVMRIALEHLRDTNPTVVPRRMKGCDVVSFGEDGFCATCGRRWVGDKPECIREGKGRT